MARRIVPFKKCTRCLKVFPRETFKPKPSKRALRAVESTCKPCRREGRSEANAIRRGVVGIKLQCAICFEWRSPTAFGANIHKPLNKICYHCVREGKQTLTHGLRLCGWCLTAQPTDQFYPNNNLRSGLFGHCIKCHKQQANEISKSPAAKLRKRGNWFVRAYGITLAERDAMERHQGGCCAICKQIPPLSQALVVDHNHETGEVRGLLCERCNKSLGFFRDDPSYLLAAVCYLTKKPPLPFI